MLNTVGCSTETPPSVLPQIRSAMTSPPPLKFFMSQQNNGPVEQQLRRKMPLNRLICPHILNPFIHHLHEDSVQGKGYGWGRQMGVPRRTYSFPCATVHPRAWGYKLPRTPETGIKKGTRELRNGWKVVGRGIRKADPPATLPYVRKLKDRPALDTNE